MANLSKPASAVAVIGAWVSEDGTSASPGEILRALGAMQVAAVV
jgi:hypothetical protein